MEDPTTMPPRGKERHFGLSAGYFCLAVVAVLFFGVLASGVAANKPTTVNITNPGSGGITVTGSATVHASPDIATLSLGVSTTAPTIRTARANTATAATRVIDALHAAGVADADITTSNISLYQANPIDYSKLYVPCPPVYSTSDGSVSSVAATPPSNPLPSPADSPVGVPPASPVSVSSAGVMPICPSCYGSCGGWTYSETLTVIVRDLDRASDALDGAIAAGATNVGGISFDVSNRDAFLSSAQTAAVAVAKAQAGKLAAAAGATLGAPLSITTSYYGGVLYAADAKSASGGGSTPISPGTLDITASVTVVFALNS